MKNNEETKSSLFEKIRNSDSEFLGHLNFPEYGQVVRSGLIQGKPYIFDHAIGYVVQIRKKRGQYASDQYLVRHPDGSLVVHENQSFWLVSDELAEAALSHFKLRPDDEGGDTEYTIGQELPEVGYIIEFKDGDPLGDSPPFGLTITTAPNE